MRFTQVAAASLVAPLVAAHGMEGMPRIVGMPRQLRASNPFAGFKDHHIAHPDPIIRPRQSTDGRCGPDGGNQKCADNECCSSAGYCGTTQEHCQAPDCLFNFGPACDANKTPAGASTRNDARPQLGSIPYGGGGIYVCNNPGTVAITYDDGPYIYTENVMAQFEARGAHATFFITGNNIGKGAIDENWAGVIKKMYDNGHQVASHTWSHQDLSLITKEEVYDQMVKNEMAIRNIIGKYPTYMRPPYSSCDAECQEVMSDLGYVVSYFDLDTDDYNQLTPEKIQVAKDNFKNGIDTRNSGDPYDGDRLVIGHDIHQLTAENLTAYMLDYLYAQGLTAVTMGECLQDPKENWYRDSTPAPPSTSSTRTSSAVPTPTGPTSKDGMCGSTGGDQSCVGWVGIDGLLGECCSQYGYCGNTADHCQTGCQAGFGKCGAQPSASPSASASVSASVTGPVPTPTGPSTTDGSCGAANGGMTCIGFNGPAGLSECCSQYGYCGNTDIYCGTGCQAGFGKCGAQDVSSASSSVAASSTPAPSSSADVSKDTVSSSTVLSSSATASSDASTTIDASSSASQVSSAPSATPTTSGERSRDGSCGGVKGYTCVGFSTLEGVKSECCSAWGYCGSSEDHCGAGCNPIYGNCPSVSSSSVSSSIAVSSASEKSESTSSTVATPTSEVISSSVSASASASASEYVSASVSEHVSASASASVSEHISASASASASVSDYASVSVSVSEHVSASASTPASEKPEEHESTSVSVSASATDSASKDSYPTSSVVPASEYPASTPGSSETVSSSSSVAVSASSEYPVSSSASSAYPVSTMTPTPVHPSSSFSTAIVRPSSTSCSTTATPTPTKLPVSSNGKCGEANGGQTCAGYKTLFGVEMGCCCKQSGRCSIDPWACGLGCDKGYGKCWF
ncbi:carbohydrate esterase family 4 protein [Alternaria burnsii]|uniref:Carbohydrate esterase family 4 protein n=1 Tax=Alternaria burnsii TaxID=1187904 RepID=A0A8H7B899_9PLEO|nr:carbohydrate esterase family 4 protein [Alternaria burnsii]KAF7677191.1 carbohydrate esterase family 4 protein [Alternaria burnsii]CAI9634080.1 unnamed protein product [Alternaria burnsii]